MFLTFFTGVMIGVYTYFTGFAPVERTVTTAVEERQDTFTIISNAYGSCDATGTCPQFRIDDTGEYRYFFYPGGSGRVLRSGEASRRVVGELEEVLRVSALRAQSQPTTPALCNSYTEGIDVRYEITLNDAEYTLDSCGTTVDPASELWLALSGMWLYFEQITN
jgi:hypothetical protein